MVVALVTLWKRPRTAAIAITFALTLLLFCSNAWIAKSLVRSLEWQYLPATQIPAAEAIVVLDGATKSAFPPRPTVDLSESGDAEGGLRLRVIYDAELYRQKRAPIIILNGGRIDWPGGGSPESADMATMLTSIGIPSEAIVQEPESLNTYQNAVNVRKILSSRGINQVLLVTSAMRMPRSLRIFQRLENLAPLPYEAMVVLKPLSL